jgi:hypothetical protein
LVSFLYEFLVEQEQVEEQVEELEQEEVVVELEHQQEELEQAQEQELDVLEALVTVDALIPREEDSESDSLKDESHYQVQI